MRALLLTALTIGSLAFATVAYAKGTMKLAGEVKALTADTMEISDGNHVYVIKKSAIRTKSALSKSVKVGSQVELELMDDGIVETKDAPPAKPPGAK